MDEKALEAKRKYQREWRKRNIEKVKAYQKAYREKNRSKWEKYETDFYTRLAKEQEQ